MNYVDTNVFILAAGSELGREAGASRRFLQKVIRGETPAVTCTLTWDEIVWGLEREIGRAEGQRAGEQFLNFPNLAIAPVTLQTLHLASTIRKQSAVDPRDAIHAASALENRAGEIVSFDRDFDRVKGLKRVEPR